MTTTVPTPQGFWTTPLAGVILMAGSCTVWGLSGLFYHQIQNIPALEIFAHRTIWSVVLFIIILSVQRRLNVIPQTLRQPRLAALIALASLMISVNWVMFIWAIQERHALEASLGYYIFPMIAVLFGAVIYGERPSRGQLGAIALAGAAIVVLTVGLGVAPWIALLLAVTFGIYGAIKKSISIGPVASVTIEVVMILPFALLLLWYLGWGSFGRNLHDTVFLILSGGMTAIPLLMMSAATRRVSLTTIGLVQYLNPSLQFLVATLVLAEPFTTAHGIAFPLIWAALVIYTIASWRQDRAARRVSRAASASGTTV
ncbi:EamA family transporter RarD [Rhodobacteraceae bacterium KMM 6894]|nr:EamA family transporter RarD [Rhodobacteraceae bacterium KMM 6894]